jgi:hypothetical protein
MVVRHKANGKVSSNEKNNIFISVGSVRNVLRSALNKTYPGDLCEAALCSIKTGDAHFLVCDCKGEKSHRLPEITGEADKAKWAKIMRLSKEAIRE